MLRATASGSPPPTFCDEARHRRQEGRQHDAAVLLQLEISPVTNATVPFIVAGVARRASIA